MPTYEFSCECGNEFEEFQSMNDPFPECPTCKKVEGVKRLISGGSGRGIVELTGHDLKTKLKDDVRKLKSDIRRDEKVLSNMVGESRYHSNMLKK